MQALSKTGLWFKRVINRIEAAFRMEHRTMDPITLADGRPIPNLLFVSTEQFLNTLTSEDRDAVLVATGNPHQLDLLTEPSTVKDVAKRIRDAHANRPDLAGVVILGGHQSIPLQQVSAIDHRLRAELKNLDLDQTDLDAFIVWSDNVYGDHDGDLLPELPVSRIPTDAPGGLVRRALNAPVASVARQLNGVRLDTLLFAETVYNNIGVADGPIQTTPVGAPLGVSDIAASANYIVLHGNDSGFKSFGDGFGSVINVDSLGIPDQELGSTVFASCCWSGVIVAEKAANFVKFPDDLAPGDSLALTFLNHGLIAYIGFTGSHWVTPKSGPTDPYQLLGVPLHEQFWCNYLTQNMAPSQALFEAKKTYIANTPYCVIDEPRFDMFSRAVEMKVFWSATCLGLGW